MFVRYTPARTTSSKLLPAALRTAERFRKTHSVSGRIPPSTTVPVAGAWAACPLKQRKTHASTAWENGPTGGVSSDEVIAVLLMANSVEHWVNWSEWWARGCARPRPGAGAPDPTRAHHSEPRDRQRAEFESHGIGFPQTQELVLAADRQFPKFISLTIIVPCPHDSAIRWREGLEGISQTPAWQDDDARRGRSRPARVRSPARFDHERRVRGVRDTSRSAPSLHRSGWPPDRVRRGTHRRWVRAHE